MVQRAFKTAESARVRACARRMLEVNCATIAQKAAEEAAKAAEAEAKKIKFCSAGNLNPADLQKVGGEDKQRRAGQRGRRTDTGERHTRMPDTWSRDRQRALPPEFLGPCTQLRRR